jgi:hypothetical protein
VLVALFHAQNSLQSNISNNCTTNSIININITHQTDAQRVACQTFVLTLHITTPVVAMIISKRDTQHGMDICTHLTSRWHHVVPDYRLNHF